MSICLFDIHGIFDTELIFKFGVRSLTCQSTNIHLGRYMLSVLLPFILSNKKVYRKFYMNEFILRYLIEERLYYRLDSHRKADRV